MSDRKETKMFKPNDETINVFTDGDICAGELEKALLLFESLSDNIKIHIVGWSGPNGSSAINCPRGEAMFEAVDEDFFDMLQILDDITSKKGITKNMVYISRDIEKLKKWIEHNGKGILAAVRPLNDLELQVNRFLLSDNKDIIINSLRTFIHI